MRLLSSKFYFICYQQCTSFLITDTNTWFNAIFNRTCKYHVFLLLDSQDLSLNILLRDIILFLIISLLFH